MTAHYRTQMSFSWESLKASQTALNRLYQAAFDWGEPGDVLENFVERFLTEINDDLNFPRALAVVWDLVKADAAPGDKKATLLALEPLLGLNIKAWQPKKTEVPAEILAMVEARQQARASKNFEESDRLRGEVEALGYQIEDTREGPKVTAVA
jgi:cysteinyl-tRNA synthetase